MDAGGGIISYRELNERANRVAGFLVERGVRPGDRVGLVLPKNQEAVIALFGIMKTRAAYVPVDCSGPVERARTILSDCNVRAVFVESHRADLAEEAEISIVVGAQRCDSPSRHFAWKIVLEHEPIDADVAARSGDDLAYILYTSGSTGVPKGVMLTHENATSYIDWCSSVFQPESEDRFSSHAPFHFDLS